VASPFILRRARGAYPCVIETAPETAHEPDELPRHSLDLSIDVRAARTTWRRACRWILFISFLLVLPLAPAATRNARMHVVMNRIVQRGGLVLSWTEPRWLGLLHWRLRWYPRRIFVERDSYDVRVGNPEIGCINGITLWKEDEDRMRPVGDDTLAAVRDLPHVTRLEVRTRAVTDGGLRHVGALSELKRLRLKYTAVTGTGFAYLRGLSVEEVSLEGSPIDDAGLAAFDDLSELVSLDLSETRVKGPGLASLAKLPRLGSLNLSRTQIDDDGLHHLAKLNLQSLGLEETSVSDAGLAELERLPTLRWLRLCGSRVSREAVAGSGSKAVRESLQACELTTPTRR
jgi:hypothetical protein